MTATAFAVTKMTPLVLMAVGVRRGLPWTLFCKTVICKIKRAPELTEKKCINTFTSVSFLGPGFASSRRDGFVVLGDIRPLC